MFTNIIKNIHSRPLFFKVLKGFGLVASERFGRIGLNLISQFFIAKYLGPERYGIISVPTKFIGLFMSIAVFGLDELIVRELVLLEREEEQLSFIKASLVTRFLLGILATILAIVCAYYSFGLFSENFKYICLCCLIYLFYPFFTLELFFQKNTNFKVAFRSKFISSIAVTLSRIWGAIKGLSVFYFLIINVAEYLFLTLLFLISFGVYGRRLWNVKPNFSLAKKIIKEASPLALATFMVLAEQRYSLVLLQKYGTPTDIGLFSLSLTTMDILQYLPMALGISTFPILVSMYQQSRKSFYLKIKNLLAGITALNLAGFVVNFFIGDFVIKFIFGNRYTGLSTLISWIFVAGFFYNANLIRIRWLVILGELKVWLRFTIVSLVVSVILQTTLISLFGIKGIFYAWVLGQILANIIVSFYSEDFKETFIALILSPFEAVKYAFNKIV